MKKIISTVSQNVDWLKKTELPLDLLNTSMIEKDGAGVYSVYLGVDDVGRICSLVTGENSLFGDGTHFVKVEVRVRDKYEAKIVPDRSAPLPILASSILAESLETYTQLLNKLARLATK